VLLEGQLDKLEKEVDVVRNAAKDDRQSSDKIMRENRQLHIQLHEHIRIFDFYMRFILFYKFNNFHCELLNEMYISKS
jgi:hypothetical protein